LSSGFTTGGSNQIDPGTKFILAQADPFMTKAFGGKIPDSSTIPSVATPLQWNVPLATPSQNPSFSCCWAFSPSVYSNFTTALGSNSTTWSWPSLPVSAPIYAGFVNAFEAYRPIAHAIRLSCPLAPTSTTGFVHIALAVETNVGASGLSTAQFNNFATTLSNLSGYTFYKRVTLASLTQSPITLVNKWTDETAFRYSSPTVNFDETPPAGTSDQISTSKAMAANSFNIPLSWGTLLVAVEGIAPSGGSIVSTPLQAEVVLHTEGIPQKSGVLIGSTAAAYDSGTLNAVSQAVANTDFAHTESEQKTYERSFGEQVVQAMSDAGMNPNNVARHFGGRVAEMAVNAAGAFIGGLGVGGVNNRPNRLMIQ